MDSPAIFMLAGTVVAAALLFHVFGLSDSSANNTELDGGDDASEVSEAIVKLIDKLKSVLPEDAITSPVSRSDAPTEGHWAKQECERIPACVIKPGDSKQLCSAVAVLQAEHSTRVKHNTAIASQPLFAVRGGGHSAAAGAASVSGGVLIDLGRLNGVRISDNRQSVSIGAGARWIDVSRTLDKEGLAAVGGRNSHVGVSGLTLGGKPLYA